MRYVPNTSVILIIQNSGLGNTVNPLVSLAAPEVYSVPMLLLIGWRGEPGKRDEPQHMLQGQITSQLLGKCILLYCSNWAFLHLTHDFSIMCLNTKLCMGRGREKKVCSSKKICFLKVLVDINLHKQEIDSVPECIYPHAFIIVTLDYFLVYDPCLKFC